MPGKICEFRDEDNKRCQTRACSNFPGMKGLKYCAKHKLDGMENTTTKRCRFEKCTLIPTYAKSGTKTALYCLEHKEEDMIDIKHVRCEKCNIRPSYNLPEEKNPKFCIKHKTQEMIDVVSRRCLFEKCPITPNFGFKSDMKAIYCKKHKSEEMIDVYKFCEFKDCETSPSYGYKGGKARFCKKHKLEDMVISYNNKCETCGKTSIFNFEGEKLGRFCVTHKLEGMIDVKNKMCLTHLCQTQIHNPLYEGYCTKCFIQLFPDRPLARNFKTKEREVVQFIIQKYPSYAWSFDKTIGGGTSKRRPDIFLNLKDKALIIEIDENQHTDYDCSCENKRIMELSLDIKHKDMIFIRFNPDGYKIKDKLIKSYWTISKTGMCVLNPRKREDWNKRLEILQEQIDYWMLNNSDKNIEIIQLFYDQN
jgi:hypothetical protein